MSLQNFHSHSLPSLPILPPLTPQLKNLGNQQHPSRQPSLIFPQLPSLLFPSILALLATSLQSWKILSVSMFPLMHSKTPSASAGCRRRGCVWFARDTRVEGGGFSLAGEPYLLGVLHSGLGLTGPSGILQCWRGDQGGVNKDCESRKINIWEVELSLQLSKGEEGTYSVSICKVPVHTGDTLFG